MTEIDDLLASTAAVADVGGPALVRGRDVLDTAVTALRAQRRRRSRAGQLGLAAACIAGVLTVGAVAPLPWNPGGQPAARAYAVTPQDDGEIRIEADWNRLHDLTDLQHAIDAAGARTHIYVTGDAPMPSLPRCAPRVPTAEEIQKGPYVPPDAVEVPGTDDAHLLMIVRPSLLPPGATVIATFDYSEPDDHHASSSIFMVFSTPPTDCAPLSEWYVATP